MTLPLHESLRGAGVNSPVFTEAYEFVTKTVKAMYRARTIVPIHGGQYTSEDVHDLVADFFVPSGRLADLAIAAIDERHFKSSVQLTLQRLSLDAFRKTDIGKLRKRIDRRLAMRPDVVVVPPRRWALEPYAENPPWASGREPLTAAVAAVAVTEPTHAPDSARSAQVATVESLDAVCTAVLKKAAAPVARTDLLSVVTGHILPHGRHDGLPDESDEADGWLRARSTVNGPSAAVARAVWDQLTDDERQLIPDLHVESRALADEGVLQLQKSALAVRQKKLEAKLRTVLDGLDDLDDVARHLLELAADHVAGQDAVVGP